MFSSHYERPSTAADIPLDWFEMLQHAGGALLLPRVVQRQERPSGRQLEAEPRNGAVMKSLMWRKAVVGG